MLRSAIGFFKLFQLLAIALVVALFGVSEVAHYSWEGVKVVCFAFIVVFLAFAVFSFLGQSFRKRPF